MYRLSTTPPTNVLASLFSLRQSTNASLRSLELELRDFTDRCIGPRVDVVRESYEQAIDVDFADVMCVQSVLTLPNNSAWLARAYARVGGDQFLLIHWNGPQAEMSRLVIPIFVSLVPLFASDTHR